jgi:beta-lactamase superfamily II metal-dependent hydrolase
LFTGDAGIPALERVADLLESAGVTPGELNFVQVPHHGSRQNVGPDILDRLLGPKGQEQGVGSAFISAPKKNPENRHPAKKVTNAFHRRGYSVHATQGVIKGHHNDAPDRPGYSTATPTQFFGTVEDDGGA